MLMLETCHGLCIEDVVRLAHHPCDATHDPRSCSCLDMCARKKANEGEVVKASIVGPRSTQTIQRYPKTVIQSYLAHSMTRMLRVCTARSCCKINISQAQCPESKAGNHRSKMFWPSMGKQHQKIDAQHRTTRIHISHDFIELSS